MDKSRDDASGQVPAGVDPGGTELVAGDYDIVVKTVQTQVVLRIETAGPEEV